MYFNDNKIFIDAELYYTTFRRKGRLIFSPCKELKKLQRHFLNVIKWQYTLNLSVKESVNVHTGKKWILKMDIKDFYTSVPTEQILKFIHKVCEHIEMANVNYYFDLVTVNGKLPTGAPTSPHIANACFEPIEKEIANVCQTYNVNFSKYMDDLTFSSDDKSSLNYIEKYVEILLNQNGYKLNNQKTKYISSNRKQEILGMVVNDNKVRLAKSFKRNIRAMIFNYIKLKTVTSDITDVVNEQQLKGYLSYIKSVDFPFYLRLESYAKNLSRKYDINLKPLFKDK